MVSGCAYALFTTEPLIDAWAEAGPIADEADVFVLPPRTGSAATGLQKGDVIVAADGRDFGSYETLYEVVDGHQSSEAIELRVRRDPGELTDILVVRP